MVDPEHRVLALRLHDESQLRLQFLRAASEAKPWPPELTISVNLSAKQFYREDLAQRITRIVRGEGFSVAIDDFGTGYSSLTHLKHFPIDTLKIDISFIADLETDPGDAAITEAIIGLARGLGLKVVAEGVGTREQLEFLDVRGCHYFQGYWVSKPLPAQEFVDFVKKRPQ